MTNKLLNRDRTLTLVGIIATTQLLRRRQDAHFYRGAVLSSGLSRMRSAVLMSSPTMALKRTSALNVAFPCAPDSDGVELGSI
jgi:hypothetical protein